MDAGSTGYEWMTGIGVVELRLAVGTDVETNDHHGVTDRVRKRPRACIPVHDERMAEVGRAAALMRPSPG